MATFIKQNRFHLLIWAIVIIFVLIAPGLFAVFVVKEGKPIQFNQELPPPTDQIKFSVDRLDPLKSNWQDQYNLWGWAFILGDSDQSAYERYIVLQSDKNTYFYPSTFYKRLDVQAAFPDISMDISDSGFSTYISEGMIRAGEYQIGVVFKHKSNGDLSYATSNKILIRTPNTLSLDVAQASEIISTTVASQDAQPTDFLQSLPTTDQIKYSIDRLDPMTSNGQAIYNLWGWAFYLGDSDQSGYERYIILQSDAKTLSFPTQSFERTDLQKAFPDLNIDVINTGFSTNLSTNDIPGGTYRIGILFKNLLTGKQYFTLTDKYLNRPANLEQLELIVK